METLIDVNLIKKMTPVQAKKVAFELVLSMPPEQAKEFILTWIGDYKKRTKNSISDNKITVINELNSLIGLTNVKELIHKQIFFSKLKQSAISRGRIISDISNNMVFIGNPGTCKSTVAKLFSKLLYEEGVVSKSVFIEASRAEIVSKYAGHTAKNVKHIVNNALGGVLFIDEAYSLTEQNDLNDGFGEEAVNTLLQEVEKHRGELTVILAGYPNEMERFLESNSGLKSRFSQVIHFDNFNPEELYLIAEGIAKQNGFAIQEGVKSKLLPIFKKALKDKNFGNGRYSRSLIEQAQLTKASSLAKRYTNFENLKDEELFVLNEEDFSCLDSVKNHIGYKKVGFCVK